MMTSLRDLFTTSKKTPAAPNYAAELDPARVRPELGEVLDLAEQLAERGRGFTAERDRLEEELAAKRAAFGTRALAAELAGNLLPEADHEAHEAELAPTLRERDRIVRQLVDGQDVRVLEPRGEADLALEALGAEHMGQLGVQHLERDRAVVPEVLRQVDHGHATPAELELDTVTIS